jgi:hypothetical protein
MEAERNPTVDAERDAAMATFDDIGEAMAKVRSEQPLSTW